MGVGLGVGVITDVVGLGVINEVGFGVINGAVGSGVINDEAGL